MILDVVYNHTCEGNHLGPTLSLRGIDNATYYWLMPDARYYLDFTGTGNSVNASQPRDGAPDRRLAALLGRPRCTSTASASTWPTTLGRVGTGEFDRNAPIFQIIDQDPVLSRVKLIAEPWDIGLGGYQVGNFPAPLREWNGKYRDALPPLLEGRREPGVGGRLSPDRLGRPLPGRAARSRRPASTSSPRTTASRCTTWSPTASKHNEANGEHNRTAPTTTSRGTTASRARPTTPASSRCASGRSATCWPRCSCRRACRCCWAATRWAAPSAATTTPTARTTRSPGSTGSSTIGGARLLDFTRRLIELRQQHPVAAAPPLLRWATSSGTRSPRTSPGCAPTARR